MQLRRAARIPADDRSRPARGAHRRLRRALRGRPVRAGRAADRRARSLRARLRRSPHAAAGAVAAEPRPSAASPDDPRMSITPDHIAAVDAAITSRRSVRAFLDTPVPHETIEGILRLASRAPSGTNTQPWRVHVLTGAAKALLSARVRAAYDDPEERTQHTEEYAYYPTEWISPYVDRRRKIGWDLYGLLGIGKADKLRMHEQHGRNYD